MNVIQPAVKLSSMTGAMSLAAVKILLSASLLICFSKACKLSVLMASRTRLDNGSSWKIIKRLLKCQLFTIGTSKDWI